ncbi:hypothetical protein RI129_008692 [Pyrocoelia pectoralis]|uniref:DUF4817 domain-containing protein n=1 Tax=Pyrocoelia pectoralis TaxID=417401 RepID=A0AAN7V5Y1_9COLE
MVWTETHRAFALRAYFEHSRFVVATQRAFRRRFNISRNVFNTNTIRGWVRQLEDTAFCIIPIFCNVCRICNSAAWTTKRK